MPRKSKKLTSKMHIVKGFTLFAQNLPKSKNNAQVHLHFSKYGRVVACHVSQGQDLYQGSNKSNALVTFENEEDLNKALKATHFMDNRRILTSLHVPSKKEKEAKSTSEISPDSKKVVITPKQVPLIMGGNPVIFVFGINLGTSKASIKKFFSGFGDVDDVDLPFEEPDVNKGYCYVRFMSVTSVIAVMEQKVLRLDNKFLSVLPSVTENKWSSCQPIIEKVDLRSKVEKREDKRKEKEAIRKEMEEAAAAALKKSNDELRSQIIAKRAEMGGELSAAQKAAVRKDPVVVLVGAGVKAGTKALSDCAEKYGPVSRVHVPRDRFLVDRGVAYVCFTEPSHALKLLQEPCIEVEGVCVEVRPVQSDEERVEAHEKQQSGTDANPDELKIFVDSLDRSVTAQEVYGHFALFGAVTNVDLPRGNKRNPRRHNRGFAFVTFANKESREAALAAPEHKVKFKFVNVHPNNSKCGKKRKLEKETASDEQPKSKKALRQEKKALQKQALEAESSEQESTESDSESEDDENLLSSDDED